MIKLKLKEPVKVYWNSIKRKWSILQKNKVVEYANNIILKNVTFCVSEAGRQRVLLEKKKNVHAFACGCICKVNFQNNPKNLKTQVFYNPYKRMYFYEKVSGRSINPKKVIDLVLLTKEGNVLIK